MLEAKKSSLWDAEMKWLSRKQIPVQFREAQEKKDHVDFSAGKVKF